MAGETTAPLGFTEFCLRNSEECSEAASETVALSPERFAVLQDIQWAVNTSIRYENDISKYGVRDYWTYGASQGDCEDYALEKRQRLIRSGWPRSALLLTMVSISDGLFHAVLVVKTDKGDYILDNRYKQVLPWEEASYQWIKQENPANTAKWKLVVNL